jgi:16S rRNA (adenine1518-N6/adenine1519-N6)-dimethyltransferase
VIDDPRRFHLELMRKYRLRPDRKLGQHFLVDPVALERVVSAASLQGDETVLEIGAGLGALTVRLADRAREVIAVEYDRRLMPALREVVGTNPRVQLVSADILEVNLADLLGARPYRVVANIPYQITSMLLRRLLEREPVPDRLVLTVQREVAERVASGPGEMSLLALGVQMYGVPTVVASCLPPTSTRPFCGSTSIRGPSSRAHWWAPSFAWRERASLRKGRNFATPWPPGWRSSRPRSNRA